MNDQARRFRVHSGSTMQFPASSRLTSATALCPNGHRASLPLRPITLSESEANEKARLAEDEWAKQGPARTIQAETDWLGFSIPSTCPTCACSFGPTVEIEVDLLLDAVASR